MEEHTTKIFSEMETSFMNDQKQLKTRIVNPIEIWSILIRIIELY